MAPGANEFDEEPATRSGWRRAVLAFTALGAGGFVLAKLTYRLVLPEPLQQSAVIGVMAPALALIGFTLWWLAFGEFSRAVRVLTVVAAAATAAAVLGLAQGSFGPPPTGIKMVAALWGVPLAAASTGLALAAVPRLRGWPIIPVAVAAATPCLLLRADGMTGQFDPELSFRWSTPPTDAAADRLAGRATSVPARADVTVAADPGSWAGFRGPDRTGIAPAAAFAGWDGTAPKERWRKTPIGPAWSSICAAGNFLFTQEQRGEFESVVCYRADDGTEVWSRGVPGKHTDWASGSGPRATPTFADGRLFVATAGGVVAAMSAGSGEVLWRIDLVETFGAVKPQFGFSASPLALGDSVVVSPSAPGSPRLVALSAATGEVKWRTEGEGTPGYSSPQSSTVAGVAQVLLFNGGGLFAHDPATGAELWHYDWKTAPSDPTTVQPLVLPGDRIVIGGGNKGVGTRCVAVTKSGAAWSVAERWSTAKFTPVFNDMVPSGDSLFGFDAGRLVCVNPANGSIRWREGNYGSGQALLAGDKLLLVSEKGQLACVSANADEYEELWTVPAVNGKTWNHPVVAGGRVYVRNTIEMAAYDLPGYSAAK